MLFKKWVTCLEKMLKYDENYFKIQMDMGVCGGGGRERVECNANKSRIPLQLK